jgi:dipeptidyl aminopeptidase/acylaminoacyl peptidase
VSVKPTDIAHLITLAPPTISPDGRTAVVAATRPDLEENEYRSNLWSVALDGSSPPRQLTHGDHDGAPRYSPDGHWIAFLRKASGDKADKGNGKPQIHLLPTAGGDAHRITELEGGAGAPQWSPDSTKIAFSTRVPDAGRYGLEEKVTPDKEAPRRITGLQYRFDNIGFVLDRRTQVFVVPIDGSGEPKQITEGPFENTDVSWSPDGSWLAFLSARHDSREHDLNNDVFVVRPDGSELRQVTDTSLAIGKVRFTPSGDTLVLAGEDGGPERDAWVAAQAGVFTVELAQGGRPERHTDPETYQVVDFILDGARALTIVENRGANDLISVPLDGGEISSLSTGRRQITGVDIANGTIAVAYKDNFTSGEVAVLDGGELRTLSEFGNTLREHASPRPMIELAPTAPDGQQLHGFLVLPDGDGPHPVLLMIHGGPFTQYGWALFDEAQVYADAGYAVVYTNPRGSSGYGRSYGAWIKGDVGPRSMADLMVLLDDALSRPELDGDRMGVLGGSHGGFMTSWIIGHTDRFKAAVSERAVNAIDSFEGSSDIGWGFGHDLYGKDRSKWWAMSPLAYADDITTPVLIVHSEQDWRCPLEQAQRLYVALRRRDAEVEFLLFPGEGHELSRSGLPGHRVARLEAIVEWFDRHLKATV